MTANELSPQQKRFVQEYLVDLNGTKAAIRAGYAASGAASTANRLLRNDKINELVNKGTESLIENVNVTIEKVRDELATIAFAPTAKRVKATDKLNALEKLGKYLGMFKENEQKHTHFHFDGDMSRVIADLAKPVKAEVIELDK